MIITYKNEEDVVCISDTSKFTSIIGDTVNGRILGVISDSTIIHIYGPYVKSEDGQFYSFKGIIPDNVVEKDINERMKFIHEALINKEEHIVLKYN